MEISLYQIYKSLHVISIIAWMAGMFYLPRLYVYHTQAINNPQMNETFKIMEFKLLKIIINPAMILSFLTGILIVHETGIEYIMQGWFLIKFIAVIGLVITHIIFSKHRKDFMADKNTKSERYFRMINELPTILLIIIVFAVICKPF